MKMITVGILKQHHAIKSTYGIKMPSLSSKVTSGWNNKFNKTKI